MSAYLCDPEHVGALASFVARSRNASQGYLDSLAPLPLDHPIASRLAIVLARENLNSIRCRYPHDAEGSRPGPNVATDLDYILLCSQAARRYLSDIESDPVRILKACDCYEYQSCEHPEWEGSPGHAILHAVRKAAIHALGGYTDAAWGFDTDAKIKADYRLKVAR